LAQKQIILNKLDQPEQTEDRESILAKLKEINISDKWIYDKAVKSYVSFIRFYQEHDLKYIFDFTLLDLGNLANSFQLLRMPRMKEILGKKIENFQQEETLNPKDIKYLDSNTAKQMHLKEEKIKVIQEEKKKRKEEYLLNKKQKRDEKKHNRTRKEKKEAKNRVNKFLIYKEHQKRMG
jgi:ATP-dependent RNA helicase DDX55/SPB4